MEPTIQELVRQAREDPGRTHAALIHAVSLLAQQVEALEKDLMEQKQFDHTHWPEVTTVASSPKDKER